MTEYLTKKDTTFLLSEDYKLNNRLGKPIDNIRKEPRVITLEDLIGIVSKVIELNNNPLAQPDDIDHLGNRRIRGVGGAFTAKIEGEYGQNEKEYSR